MLATSLIPSVFSLVFAPLGLSVGALIRFLADMHYLARMDVFLGSHSNMYPVVVARRIALNVNGENRFRRHSCVLLTSHAHLAYAPPAIHCEGTLLPAEMRFARAAADEALSSCVSHFSAHWLGLSIS
jgi:hypothetical protein